MKINTSIIEKSISKMGKPLRFIVVDDDPLNNFLCTTIIKQALGEIRIQTFVLPEEGLRAIASEFAATTPNGPVILLLDINMPAMNGWQFLEQFDKLEENIKKQLKVYILSSSVDYTDKEKAAHNKYVVDYLEKPLKKDTLLSIVSAA